MSAHLFIAHAATGKSVVRHDLPSAAFAPTVDIPADHVGLLYDGDDPDGVETDLVGGTIVFVPRVADPGMALAVAKLEKCAAVRELRDRIEARGVLVNDALIDTDPDAQRKVSGLVLKALVKGAAFSVEFRRGDNVVVTLDGPEMIALGVLVSDHVEQTQYRKNALDQQIGSAATLAELDAIDIVTGWP